jgi:hypothetical protein
VNARERGRDRTPPPSDQPTISTPRRELRGSARRCAAASATVCTQSWKPFATPPWPLQKPNRPGGGVRAK